MAVILPGNTDSHSFPGMISEAGSSKKSDCHSFCGVDEGLPIRLVSASRGKVARAEPVAARFERGKAKLAGRFPELEDELAGLTMGGGYEGPGRSPDRADACVWALSELQARRGEPGIRRL